MSYVYRELPPEVVRRLEALAFVKDPDDLATKSREALSRFHEATQQVDEKRFRQRISKG